MCTGASKSISYRTLAQSAVTIIGDAEGSSVGRAEGTNDGVFVGTKDGIRVGKREGRLVGGSVGNSDGSNDGVDVMAPSWLLLLDALLPLRLRVDFMPLLRVEFLRLPCRELVPSRRRRLSTWEDMDAAKMSLPGLFWRIDRRAAFAVATSNNNNREKRQQVFICFSFEPQSDYCTYSNLQGLQKKVNALPIKKNDQRRNCEERFNRKTMLNTPSCHRKQCGNPHPSPGTLCFSCCNS